MFQRSRTTVVKKRAAKGADLALALARDEKFRKRLLSAARHGAVARGRAAGGFGLTATASRLASDQALRRELRRMTNSLEKAWGRVEKKRSHTLRNSVIAATGAGAVVALAVPQSRRWLLGLVGLGGRAEPRTLTDEIEVAVPVSTAYNQWTQFEDFPLFMEGVDHVQQLDDTRLHWVATVAGKQAEWDAKIVEQHPDRQISWISEDGKQTRGTVTFEERGATRTLITLSMSYRAEGVGEALGSVAGLDRRRVRGDLTRFKELIESRGTETGAWRGEVSAGTKE